MLLVSLHLKLMLQTLSLALQGRNLRLRLQGIRLNAGSGFMMGWEALLLCKSFPSCPWQSHLAGGKLGRSISQRMLKAGNVFSVCCSQGLGFLVLQASCITAAMRSSQIKTARCQLAYSMHSRAP